MTAPDRRKEGPERRRLESSVADLAAEVLRLRGALERRPSRAEVTFRRRVLGASIALLALLLITVHDEHVERCAPGTRTAQLVESFLAGADAEQLRREGLPPAPRYCDATFPLHDHDGNGWPRPYNALGVVFYAAVGVAVVAFVRRPLRRPDPEE